MAQPVGPRALVLLAALSLHPLPAGAAGPAWTVDDVLLAESADSFVISPDGRYAVWVRTAMDPDEGERVSHLWLTDLQADREIPLTRGKANHSSPRWSPDGEYVAFLSDRALPDGDEREDEEGPKAQLWLIRPFGGEPWPVTEIERRVAAFAWKDADTLVFCAQEDPSLYERTAKEREDDSRVVDDEDHEPPVRLFAVDPDQGEIRRLSDNTDRIDALEISPDGRFAVTRHQKSLSYEFDQRVPPETWLTDLDAGTRIRLFADGSILPVDVVWELDSKGFYVVSERTRHPRYRMATISVLHHYDATSGKVREVPLGSDRGLGDSGQVRATPDGFLALLAAGVRFEPVRYRRRGSTWSAEPIRGEHATNIFDWSVSRDGRTVVYEHSTASRPVQWYRARLDGAKLKDARAVTRLNRGFADKPVPRTEIVDWNGARDERVEGILYYPLGFEAGRRHPLILAIHGGPAAADLDAWDQSWAYPKVLLAQKGAFVLEVNYHGSANYGLDWVESIGDGRYYDLEIPDLQTGADRLIERGLADPERLATMGWSNGSILSTELVTRDGRFKAASVGAGDVEWISDWANVDFGAAFDNYYLGASPLEDPELYVRKSPFFRLADVSTPTLIFFGTEDRNVPTDQGWSHFRALQQLGNTEVRFVLFPGEPHGLRKLAHQRRKVEEELAWFDRHLFRTPEAGDEALRKGSPLEVALRRASFARTGTAWGLAVDGTLVPETVEHGGLRIGRFEVTRAQWAAFDPGAGFEAGTGNLPASGIAFDRALEYCRWLGERTGETWRLPLESEARELRRSEGQADGDDGQENTLDWWAGYGVNPDDARRLAEKVEQLGPGALLTEVGRFRAAGDDEPVFDLDGNVAEWAVAEDGSGVLLGGSADRPADAKGSAPAGEVYRGLRVVRGEPSGTRD